MTWILSQLESASLEVWLGFITGSGGAIVLAILWVRTALQQNKELITLLREKETKFEQIARDAIASIQTSIGLANLETEHRKRVESLLTRIETALERREKG